MLTTDESRFTEEDLIGQGIVQYAFPWDATSIIVLRATTRDSFADTGQIDGDPFAAPEPKDSPRTPDQRYADILASSRLIEPDLAQRFVEQSQMPLTLEQSAFADDSRIVVLSGPDYGTLFRPEDQSTEPGWKRLYERFPEAAGIATVSRVVFSHDGQSALMSISLASGPLAGRSGFLIFRRVGRLWVCEQVYDAPSGVS